MNNTASTDYDIISNCRSFEYDTVHANETVVSYSDRLTGCMLLVKIQSALLRVKRMEIIVDDFTVSTYCRILADYNG